MSPYRIAALLNDPFELPDDLPGRTESGDVWLRWASVGNYSGWYAIGTRLPDPNPHRFWDRVATLAARTGNGNMDAVHVIGPGVLSLGAFGITASTGEAQRLLGMCMAEMPMRFMEVMAPALFGSGVYPHFGEKHEGSWGFADKDRDHVPAALAVRCGSDSIHWSPEAKKCAAVWVECCSRLLRDTHFDGVQRLYLQEHAVTLLDADSRRVIRFPLHVARDAWQWTAEQQSVWAAALVMAIADPEATSRLVLAAHRGDPLATLRAMRIEAHRFSEEFARRANMALQGIEELFGVNLGTGDG